MINLIRKYTVKFHQLSTLENVRFVCSIHVNVKLKEVVIASHWVNNNNNSVLIVNMLCNRANSKIGHDHLTNRYSVYTQKGIRR